jgi:hypothetical protein
MLKMKIALLRQMSDVVEPLPGGMGARYQRLRRVPAGDRHGRSEAEVAGQTGGLPIRDSQTRRRPHGGSATPAAGAWRAGGAPRETGAAVTMGEDFGAQLGFSRAPSRTASASTPLPPGDDDRVLQPGSTSPHRRLMSLHVTLFRRPGRGKEPNRSVLFSLPCSACCCCGEYSSTRCLMLQCTRASLPTRDHDKRQRGREQYQCVIAGTSSCTLELQPQP